MISGLYQAILGVILKKLFLIHKNVLICKKEGGGRKMPTRKHFNMRFCKNYKYFSVFVSFFCFFRIKPYLCIAIALCNASGNPT